VVGVPRGCVLCCIQCTVVWCGVLRYQVWCGVVWHLCCAAAVWWGVLRCGAVRCGAVRCCSCKLSCAVRCRWVCCGCCDQNHDSVMRSIRMRCAAQRGAVRYSWTGSAGQRTSEGSHAFTGWVAGLLSRAAVRADSLELSLHIKSRQDPCRTRPRVPLLRP
jgi:hypothetical protein